MSPELRERAVKIGILAMLRARHPDFGDETFDQIWEAYRGGDPALVYANEEFETAINAALNVIANATPALTGDPGDTPREFYKARADSFDPPVTLSEIVHSEPD